MGVDKAELTLNGRTFLEIQARKLQLLGAADIIISGKASDLPVPGPSWISIPAAALSEDYIPVLCPPRKRAHSF